MQTMNQALYDLHSKDLISLEMALSQSSEQKELKTMISQDARNMRTSMYRGAG
jgi:Tfp pilus assembly ATPase PilU